MQPLLKIQTYKKNIFIIVAIVIVGVSYQYKYLNTFPSHIHAWAQNDRYALALEFIENNFNFFKPQTFVLNHQFPGDWKVPSKESITAVDFPVHDFIPAVFMKITGNTDPIVFRMYILLYSFLGLFFLFKLAKALTDSFAKGIFICLLAATSPVYVYYQSGFLPTIPCLSNTITGLYFYFIFLKKNNNKDFNLSLLFLALAALSRTTFLIPLLAVLGLELLRITKKESGIIGKIVPVIILIAVLLTNLLYNNFLRRNFGSDFLNHPLPPESFDQAKGLIIIAFKNWSLQYFTWIHYLTFVIIIVVSGVFYAYKKPDVKKEIIRFALLVVVMLSGLIFFAFLMLKQFPDHDYYFLDTFYIPIILFVTLCLSLFPVIKERWYKFTFNIIVGIVTLLLLIQPLRSQRTRMQTGVWNKTQAVVNNFEDSEVFLDSIGIKKDAKMLVIDAVAPNIPFVLMQRKGYAVMSVNQENLNNALTWEYDYIVVQNESFVSDIYPHYPELLLHLNKIACNGKITVCKYSKIKNNNSLDDFLGFSNKKPEFKNKINFEEIPEAGWQNTISTSKVSFSGEKAGHLHSDAEFGITFKSGNIPVLTKRSSTLVFSSSFLKDTTVNCSLVVTINSKGRHLYYNQYNMGELIKRNHSWEKVVLLFQLPHIQLDDYEFGIYLWNMSKDELFYDDFGFEIQ